MKQKIYVITGQTATGKTSTALQKALENSGELVNIDSRQLYKRLDIVTGKDLQITNGTFIQKWTMGTCEIGYYPIETQAQLTKIWLYDVLDPKKTISAFDYAICAQKVIQDIINRKKTPIIVGGSYLYIKHLVYGSIQTHAPPNEELRIALNQKSVLELQTILMETNKSALLSLNNSDKNNPHRLIRKIEIASSPQQELNSDDTPPLIDTFDVQITGYVFGSKDMLIQQITKRVEERLKQGAVEEGKRLLKEGYSHEDPGLRTIGYTQIFKFLNGKINFDQMKDEWIHKEIQYAKRQETFMKQNSQITWKIV